MLNPKIKKYKFDGVEEILNSEYPIDFSVTDTQMSAFSLACSLGEKTIQHPPYNQKLLDLIYKYNPNINHTDKF